MVMIYKLKLYLSIIHYDRYMREHKFRYNENERRKILDPIAILKLLGVTTGMTFLDIGSNNGYFSLEASKMVGPTGRIYAIDIDREALTQLEYSALENRIQNIVTSELAAEDLKSHQFDSDIIFFGTVLHDLKDPLKALINAKNNLVQGGKIYNLDWQKSDSSIGPPLNIRFSKQYVTDLVVEAGLKVARVQDIDTNFYLFEIVAD